MTARDRRVLLVTGSLIAGAHASVWSELRKQRVQYRASSKSALDLKVKLTPIELFLAHALAQRRLPDAPWVPAVERFFAKRLEAETPTLTEVVLAGALAAEGLEFTGVTLSELFADPERRERLLADHRVALVSTTLIRDLSELEPLVALIARPGLRVVLGGALIGLMHRDWKPMSGVDVLAVGYGEVLVPAIARWIRAGYGVFPAGEGYDVEGRDGCQVVRAHRPTSKSLDGLPRADWAGFAARHGRRLRMVRYESVRGCPYRCSFCNFPFLFDDTTFRVKSAKRIADDWEHFEKDLGVEVVSCFDSLFTVPRSRIRELTDELRRRRLNIRWICYARGDDLVTDDLLPRMRDAGLVQVHIGAESGSQLILDNMNKRQTVAKNADALIRCRELGVSSIVTLILGYPGETRATAEETYRLLERARPDFYLLALLNTRMEGVPLLSPESRTRFALHDWNDGRTNQPFFRHATMDAREAMEILEDMDHRVRAARLSLWAPLFFDGTPEYELAEREALLDYQSHLIARYPRLGKAFAAAHRWADRKLAAQIVARYPAASMVAA
ncbi:MAG: radical SAM protein [Deltaproteobacteria bacterium]|nr:radical SAM protein [Deltaproteobacteria bacterium]